MASFGDITMTLDPKSIQAAIDKINSISDDLQRALNELCKFLLKRGVKIAKTNLGNYGISPDGKLASSIRVEMEDGSLSTGYLIAGYPGDHGSDNESYSDISYAVFVEFGYGRGSVIKSKKTGKVKEVKGVASDHILAGKVGYERGINKHTGVTPTGQSFRGWVYYNREKDHFYVSQGQPPKPFMYDTYLELMDIAEKDGASLLEMFMNSGV